MMETNKRNKQKGFTFVELLVIMVIVAILSGIGIQFVLGTQENKAKLTNLKSFVGKDVPTAIFSYVATLGKEGLSENNGAIITADLIADGLESQTEWGDTWDATVGAVTSTGAQRVVLCYPLDKLGGGSVRIDLTNQLDTYIKSSTNWGAGDGDHGLLTAAVVSTTIGDGSSYCGPDDYYVNYVIRSGS